MKKFFILFFIFTLFSQECGISLPTMITYELNENMIEISVSTSEYPLADVPLIIYDKSNNHSIILNTNSDGKVSFKYKNCTNYVFIYCPVNEFYTCAKSFGIEINEKVSGKEYPTSSSIQYFNFCPIEMNNNTAFCVPLVFLLGLLFTALFYMGRNPLGLFDITSVKPKMNIRYMPMGVRVGNKFDASTILPAIGNLTSRFSSIYSRVRMKNEMVRKGNEGKKGEGRVHKIHKTNMVEEIVRQDIDNIRGVKRVISGGYSESPLSRSAGGARMAQFTGGAGSGAVGAISNIIAGLRLISKGQVGQGILQMLGLGRAVSNFSRVIANLKSIPKDKVNTVWKDYHKLITYVRDHTKEVIEMIKKYEEINNMISEIKNKYGGDIYELGKYLGSLEGKELDKVSVDDILKNIPKNLPDNIRNELSEAISLCEKGDYSKLNKIIESYKADISKYNKALENLQELENFSKKIGLTGKVSIEDLKKFILANSHLSNKPSDEELKNWANNRVNELNKEIESIQNEINKLEKDGKTKSKDYFILNLNLNELKNERDNINKSLNKMEDLSKLYEVEKKEEILNKYVSGEISYEKLNQKLPVKINYQIDIIQRNKVQSKNSDNVPKEEVLDVKVPFIIGHNDGMMRRLSEAIAESHDKSKRDDLLNKLKEHNISKDFLLVLLGLAFGTGFVETFYGQAPDLSNRGLMAWQREMKELQRRYQLLHQQGKGEKPA